MNNTIYRLPKPTDFEAINRAKEKIGRFKSLNYLPDEKTPLGGGKGAGRAFSQRAYGIETFSDHITP